LPRSKVMKGGETVLYSMQALVGTGFHGRDAKYTGTHKSEEIERQGYEIGFSSGEKAGLEMGHQKAAVLLDKLDTIISEITSIKGNILRELEPQITQLAMTIARRIILDELSAKPEIMVGIVKEAMRKIERTGVITIKLNPSLYELFSKIKPQLLELHPDIVFDVDPSASVTGPLVIGPRQEVVTDIDVQLLNIAEDMEGGRGAD
jgi:flagellar assembly protein FliH